MKRILLTGGLILSFFYYETPAQYQFWEQFSPTGKAVYQLEIVSIYTTKPQFNVTSFDYPVYISSDSINFNISFTPDSNIYYVDTVFIISNLTTSPYLIRLPGTGAPAVNT